MNNYFQRALRISRVDLVNNIDYDNLKDYLIQYKILPTSTLENIDSIPSRRQKIREMLDCLPRRDDHEFPKFLISLHRSNQSHIATKLYEKTIDLIEPTASQVKEQLEINIRNMLSETSSVCLENKPVTSNTVSGSTREHCNEPIENSLSFSDPKPMEAEDEYSFMDKESKHETSLLTEASMTPTQPFSSSQQFNNLAYKMESNPRGLFCIITTKEGVELTGDCFPEFKTKASPSESNSMKIENELQKLFWDFSFCCCIIEIENSTFHRDKLNQVVYQFSKLLLHDKYDSCAMALLGFSESDLGLAEILSWFTENNCSFLVSKPKLFLIQIPNDRKSNPNDSLSNLISGVKIPEDSLVAIGMEDNEIQAGLISSFIHVCRKAGTSSFSAEEIFSHVREYSESNIVVENSLKKTWILDLKQT